MTLKQTADTLGINYSTAKTIIQTFRREKRIAKKSKHLLETKKAVKKSHFLTRFLTKTKVDSLVNSILFEELVIPENKLIKELQNVSDALTAPAVKITSAMPSKPLLRVDSASHMILFEGMEEGPKGGQVTRAVSVSPQDFHEQKHDLFYIYSDADPEMKYKDKIDYNDPLLLRAKISEKHNVHPEVDLNEIPNTKSKLVFDFHEYTTKILTNPHVR